MRIRGVPRSTNGQASNAALLAVFVCSYSSTCTCFLSPLPSVETKGVAVLLWVFRRTNLTCIVTK